MQNLHQDDHESNYQENEKTAYDQYDKNSVATRIKKQAI